MSNSLTHSPPCGSLSTRGLHEISEIDNEISRERVTFDMHNGHHTTLLHDCNIKTTFQSVSLIFPSIDKMSGPQEVILSTSSLSAYPFQPSASGKPTTSTSSNTQINSPSSITLHDLQSSTQIHSFKPSNCLSNNVGVVPSRQGQGGGVFVSQENKALLCFWAWQKVSPGQNGSLQHPH